AINQALEISSDAMGQSMRASVLKLNMNAIHNMLFLFFPNYSSLISILIASVEDQFAIEIYRAQGILLLESSSPTESSSLLLMAEQIVRYKARLVAHGFQL
ncbi:hypothetical protein ACJX0J_024921, partial [Zea mays]